jgi:hypothetical protein
MGIRKYTFLLYPTHTYLYTNLSNNSVKTLITIVCLKNRQLIIEMLINLFRLIIILRYKDFYYRFMFNTQLKFNHFYTAYN